MKLLNKINRNYALFSLLILLLGSFLIYFCITHFLNFETVEKMHGTRLSVIQNIERGNIANFKPFVEVKILSDTNATNCPEEIKDTLLDKDGNGEKDLFTQYKSYYKCRDTVYAITVRSDDLEKNDLLFSIGVPACILLLLVLLITNIMVIRISRSIWSPFYQNLNRLRQFSITDKKKIELIDSEIDEFRDLNNSLRELTEKLTSDYQKQKEFSENMSHELQTPLAIINAKIESLIQKEYQDTDVPAKLEAIYKTVNRLSRLNKSLILLARIESQDYEEKKNIDLRKAVGQKIDEFAEFISLREIHIKTEFNSGLSIVMNEDLLDVLLTNLITNAIRYNVQGGIMVVSLTENLLRISNTGLPLQLSPDRLFDRFEKNDKSGDSPGLGLTIVKQICELNNCQIRYLTEDNFHILEIYFKNFN